MIEPKTYSKTGLALTQSFEGCKFVAYQDSGGVWTLGYGHTNGVQPGDTCDLPQALQWLAEDTQHAVDAVNRLVTIELNQAEFDAVVDFVFNVGETKFAKSTLLMLLNVGQLEAAADQFELWDMAGGKHVAGLLRRRIAERAEFLNPESTL